MGLELVSKVGRDPGVGGECGLHGEIAFTAAEAAGWALAPVSVEGDGSDLEPSGGAARRSAAQSALSGSAAVFAAGVSGGDLVRALYGHALVGAALPRAGVAEWRDLPAPVGGVGAPRAAAAGDRGAAAGAGGGRAAGVVAGDRRLLAGGGEKGGEQVARTLLASAGSRLHVAVDAGGVPLAVRLAAGNENERQHLLPLVDTLAARAIQPRQLLADRGYAPASSSRRCARAGSTPASASRAARANRSRPAQQPARSGAAKNAGSRHATRKRTTAGRSNAPTPGSNRCAASPPATTANPTTTSPSSTSPSSSSSSATFEISS